MILDYKKDNSDEDVKNPHYFLDVRVDNISKYSAVKLIKKYLLNYNGDVPKRVYFTNVHTICLARKDPDFRRAINNADLVLPDGSGLKIAGRIFSTPIKENLNGTDFTPVILRYAEEYNWSVFLLGSTKNVISECVYKINELYPHLKIAGFNSGFFTKEETPMLINKINNSKPDILLVGMGSPKQEMLINSFAPVLNVKICFAVGGLFDFLSGDKKRAPVFIRKAGLEWLFRFFMDPKMKWNRIFIEIPLFLMLVFTKSLTVQKERIISNSF